MEDSVALVLVLGLIVGGITLILAFGYLGMEKDREQARHAEASRRAGSLVGLPGFFEASRAPTPIAFVFDDGVVHQLEHHVRKEQALVAQFVHQPSVDNLYREPGTRLQLH